MPSTENIPVQPSAPADEDRLAATRVLRQFRIVFNAVKTHFRQVEKSAGIGGAQLWALSVIQGAAGIGVNDLARALDIHQSTASNLVKTLLERGLITASRGDADSRVVSLQVLPAGVAVLDRAPAPFAGLLPNALAELDPAILARLELDLDQLIRAIKADAAAAKTPMADL